MSNIYKIEVSKEDIREIMGLINTTINEIGVWKDGAPFVVGHALTSRSNEWMQIRGRLYEQLGISDEAMLYENDEGSE